VKDKLWIRPGPYWRVKRNGEDTDGIARSIGEGDEEMGSAPNGVAQMLQQFADLPEVHGVSKRALQLWKLIEIYTEDIQNVLNCQNVAKHTEFYLG
jgi:hypothetical protein